MKALSHPGAITLLQAAAGEGALPATASNLAAAGRAGHGQRDPALPSAALQPATLPDQDTAHFERLLDLAGPVAAAELLKHLRTDLIGVRLALPNTADRLDWHVIEAKTHVLIAVAGAIGARRLQAVAETLNQMAVSHGNRQTSAAHYRDLLQLLDASIDFVSRRIGAAGGAG